MLTSDYTEKTKLLDECEPSNWFIFSEEQLALIKKRLEEELEKDLDLWDKWTKSDKRYTLVCFLNIIENNIDENLSGKVTGHLDFYVSSDNIEDLRLLWESKFVQSKFCSTRWHIIIDVKERKLVEILSFCI